MDRSITRKPNPADRLEQACGHLAEAKVGFDEERLARQLTLLVEALREEASCNQAFLETLNEIADCAEARVKYLTGAA